LESETVIGREENFEAGGAQHSRGGITENRIVVDHEDSRPRDGLPP
jgi:hypothetical protein